jgi:SAM-dependent methyltransferase
MMVDERDSYEGYIAFKGWTGDARPSADQFEEFVGYAKIGVDADILEIGFGEGAFLDWAAGRGFRTAGIETIPELVYRARGRHAIQLGTIESVDLADASYDGVFAIDVLEHIPKANLAGTLKHIARVLRPGGIFVARFPNGTSPFFGQYMYGDLTHTTILNESSMRHLSEVSGLHFVGAYNPRPKARNLLNIIRRFFAYMVRDAIETVLGYAYFGARVPMDPNLIVVLSRPR